MVNEFGSEQQEDLHVETGAEVDSSLVTDGAALPVSPHTQRTVTPGQFADEELDDDRSTEPQLERLAPLQLDPSDLETLEPPQVAEFETRSGSDPAPTEEGARRPRSIIPRPEGYRSAGRSSAPPPKPAGGGRLLRRSEGEDVVPPRAANIPAEALVQSPAPVATSSLPPRPSGSALMPMRMIEVKAGPSSPPAHPEPFSETPMPSPMSVRPPEPALRSGLSEPPPLPGSLQYSAAAALSAPQAPEARRPSVEPPMPPRSSPISGRVEPPLPSSPRVEPPIPSSPRLEPPLPSSPRTEPPLPPATVSGRRVSVEPPALPNAAWGENLGRTAPGEPPPLPGSSPNSAPVPSRPAPRIPSRNPRTAPGEPPPLPRHSVPGGPASEDVHSDPAPTVRVSRRPPEAPHSAPQTERDLAIPVDTADELELESIPPPEVEMSDPDVPALGNPPQDLHASLLDSSDEARRSQPGHGLTDRPTPVEPFRSFPPAPDSGVRPDAPRPSFPGAPAGADSGSEEDSAEGAQSRGRPRPPAPPARGRMPSDVDVEVTIDAPVENAPDPAGDRPPPPRRRLPRTPPPRTAFTGGLEDDSKRRHWWEEVFSDDFLRADFELTESQFQAEVNFIQESLEVEKGGLILDLACGGGRHASELARRGYTAVGYDLSLSQLARAGERAQRDGIKVSFLHGDMREMAFEPSFDGVYCWNASFGYFEEEKNQHVLRNIFRALKPGGRFLLDIPNRDFVVSHQPSQNWFEGDGCVCMDDMQVDFITSRLVVKRTIMLDDGRNRECTYSIRLYGLHELGRMLHEAGFRVAEVTGHISMRGVFMGGTSPRLILVVTKP